MLVDTSQPRSKIQGMAGRRQVVTFATNGDHANPLAYFRLKKPRTTIDERQRVFIEDIKWAEWASANTCWNIELILELKHSTYFGTTLDRLAELYERGWLKAAP